MSVNNFIYVLSHHWCVLIFFFHMSWDSLGSLNSKEFWICTLVISKVIQWNVGSCLNPLEIVDNLPWATFAKSHWLKSFAAPFRSLPCVCQSISRPGGCLSVQFSKCLVYWMVSIHICGHRKWTQTFINNFVISFLSTFLSTISLVLPGFFGCISGTPEKKLGFIYLALLGTTKSAPASRTKQNKGRERKKKSRILPILLETHSIEGRGRLCSLTVLSPSGCHSC